MRHTTVRINLKLAHAKISVKHEGDVEKLGVEPRVEPDGWNLKGSTRSFEQDVYNLKGES